jgi:hypothetical protein
VATFGTSPPGPGYRHARKRTRVLLNLEATLRFLAQEDEISDAVTQPH